MACASIVALPKDCGSEFLVAGSEKLYMIAYNDTHTVGTSSVRYTLSSGIYSAIGLTAGKKFVEIGILRGTTGITEELTKNTQNGTGFLTQTLTVKLANITSSNLTFIRSIANQPVAVIIKLNTGKYVAAGLNGLFELSGLSGGTGIAEGDDIGYTLTFTGIDKNNISLVNDSIVSSLIS